MSVRVCVTEISACMCVEFSPWMIHIQPLIGQTPTHVIDVPYLPRIPSQFVEDLGM